MLSKSSLIPCQHMILSGFLPYRRWEFNSCAESPGGCPGAGKPPLTCGQEVWDVVFKVLLVVVGLR